MRKAQGVNLKPGTRAESIRRIRAVLGRTQAELATALGVSAKAIQSYEQGWREAPVRFMIQLLLLLSIHRRQPLDDTPCWELKHCPREVRAECPAFTLGHGQFCWFIGAKARPPDPHTEGARMLACMNCPVIQRLLRNPEIHAAKPAARKSKAATGTGAKGR
jgi:DNA-binding XRE family transcriptional regulator